MYLPPPSLMSHPGFFFFFFPATSVPVVTSKCKSDWYISAAQMDTVKHLFSFTLVFVLILNSRRGERYHPFVAIEAV